MSRKTVAPLRMAPLQRIVAEPITDPAEQAALDKLRKRLQRKHRPGANAASRTKKRG